HDPQIPNMHYPPLRTQAHDTSCGLPHSLTQFFFRTLPPPQRSTLFPYTTLFRSSDVAAEAAAGERLAGRPAHALQALAGAVTGRSEEHTSELQSRGHLVCRLLLEKKK